MSAPALARYRHLLLDKNGTFVFDFDRFGEAEDFGATYSALGYARLDAPQAHARVRSAYRHLAERYVDENYYAEFPSVAGALAATRVAGTDADAEAEAIERELVDTFAAHERGHVPDAHAAAIAWLAQRRSLAVVSNLWSPPDTWGALFDAPPLRGCFVARVFSSEGPQIKPHPAIFRRALDAAGAHAAETLFIGDSYRCDVAGARGVGMDVVWLHGPPGPRGPRGPGRELPTRVWEASDLVALVDAWRQQESPGS